MFVGKIVVVQHRIKRRPVGMYVDGLLRPASPLVLRTAHLVLSVLGIPYTCYHMDPKEYAFRGGVMPLRLEGVPPDVVESTVGEKTCDTNY